MKHFFAIFLALLLLLPGCRAQNTDISMEDIVAAYEAAGYSVWSEVYDEKLDDGQIASIQANHPDGGYIYFSFFETHEEAAACKKEYYHPMAMGLFSIIFGQPSWIRWKVHGCVIAEYDDPNFYAVFEELLRGK